MDSASSSEDDEYEQPTQQKQKGAFKNDAEAFPDFGGGATQVQPDCRFYRRRNNLFSSNDCAQAPAASTMNFTKAWGSSKAPAAMPEV